MQSVAFTQILQVGEDLADLPAAFERKDRFRSKTVLIETLRLLIERLHQRIGGGPEKGCQILRIEILIEIVPCRGLLPDGAASPRADLPNLLHPYSQESCGGGGGSSGKTGLRSFRKRSRYSAGIPF